MRQQVVWPAVLGAMVTLVVFECVTMLARPTPCDVMVRPASVVVQQSVYHRQHERPPPTPLPRDRALHSPSVCNAFEHTEMGGGQVVGGGSHLKLPNASACCAACTSHNAAQPRPKGRINCTTFVYNHDPSHAQAHECWLKRHDVPWADIELVAGGARSWTTGIVSDRPQTIMGIAPTSRSCGDDDRWRRGDTEAALHRRRAVPGVHRDELSFCSAVAVTEADFAIDVGGDAVRVRLNRRSCP